MNGKLVLLSKNRKYNYSNIFFLFIIILAVHFIINSISYAFTSIFSFDGALNAQVSQNLSKNYSYSSTYDGGELFPHYVQTGIPVILPVAIMFSIFGETFESGLFINSIYLIFLLFGIIYYLRRCLQINYYFILIFCLLFYAIPKLFIFSFGLYGEVPALFFILLSIIFLHRYEEINNKKYLFLVGVALGFGFLTKTVSLIAIPAFILYFTINFFHKWNKDLRKFIKKFLFFFLGYVLPISIFEIYRFILLGSSQKYREWWSSQIQSIFIQAGVKSGYEDTPGFFSKIFAHLELLANNLHIHPILIIILLILIFFLFLIFILTLFPQKSIKIPKLWLLRDKSLLVLTTITLSYFGWWLIITPTQKAWYRRIFNGVILLEISSIIIFTIISLIIINSLKENNFLKIRTFDFVKKLFTWLTLLIISFNLMISENIKISFEPSDYKSDNFEVVRFITILPKESVFYVFDWMQAPIVSFAAKKDFKNISFDSEINNPGKKDNKYFVIDRDAKEVAQVDYMNILKNFDHQLEFSNAEVNIYKLINRYDFYYEEFTEIEKSDVSCCIIDFSKEIVNGLTRNVYIDETGQIGKWAQKYSGYLLKYSGEESIDIQFWVPELKNYDIYQPKLEIYINNNYIDTYVVEEAGLHKYSIPINDLSSVNSIEISLFFNSRVIAKNDMRELAFMIVEIALRN